MADKGFKSFNQYFAAKVGTQLGTAPYDQQQVDLPKISAYEQAFPKAEELFDGILSGRQYDEMPLQTGLKNIQSIKNMRTFYQSALAQQQLFEDEDDLTKEQLGEQQQIQQQKILSAPEIQNMYIQQMGLEQQKKFLQSKAQQQQQQSQQGGGGGGGGGSAPFHRPLEQLVKRYNAANAKQKELYALYPKRSSFAGVALKNMDVVTKMVELVRSEGLDPNNNLQTPEEIVKRINESASIKTVNPALAEKTRGQRQKDFQATIDRWTNGQAATSLATLGAGINETQIATYAKDVIAQYNSMASSFGLPQIVGNGMGIRFNILNADQTGYMPVSKSTLKAFLKQNYDSAKAAALGRIITNSPAWRFIVALKRMAGAIKKYRYAPKPNTRVINKLKSRLQGAWNSFINNKSGNFALGLKNRKAMGIKAADGMVKTAMERNKQRMPLMNAVGTAMGVQAIDEKGFMQSLAESIGLVKAEKQQIPDII